MSTDAAGMKADPAVRPFHVDMAEEAVADLRRRITEKAYHTLIYFNEAERGGHFAAWEQPQLLSEELRAAFRPLR